MTLDFKETAGTEEAKGGFSGMKCRGKFSGSLIARIVFAWNTGSLGKVIEERVLEFWMFRRLKSSWVEVF